MKLLILNSLLAALVGSAPVGTDIERLYFIDGINRHDGMSTSISTERGYIRVTSDLMQLSGCSTEGLALCFTSAYMTFAIPSKSTARWRAEGRDFETIGETHAEKEKGGITVIRSAQHYGTFTFFFSSQHGLVGWRLSRQTPSGVARDDWFAEGFGSLAKAAT